jgi:hypothetical protein
MASRLGQVAAWLRKNGAGVGLEIAVNAVAPFVIYQLADARLGDVGALLASSVPPIGWSVIEFARRRRVDALSLLVVAGIVFSLLAMLGGGGAKFLQLRENLVTGAIGLIFLGSILVRRPLIFYLARAGMSRRADAAGIAEFDQIKDAPRFRRTMAVMTLVWGAGLIARTAAASAMVFTLPIPTYLALHPVLGYASMGALAGWTFWYARRAQRLGRAEREAREATAVTPSAPAAASLAGTPAVP